MYIHQPEGELKPKSRVKVCIHETCVARGSQAGYDALKRSEKLSDVDVSLTPDCFRFCKQGPNVAVNGNVLHDIRPSDAERRVNKEIAYPSRRLDGAGTRSLDDLDDVLDNLL